MTTPTVVTIFHPTNDSSGFTAWAARLQASAPRSVDFRVSILGQPHLDWGVAVSFTDEEALHEWLDGAARQRVLDDGRRLGILRATGDLVLTERGGVPPGVGLFRHAVLPGRESDFVAAESRLAADSAGFSGFEGCCSFAPTASGESFSVLRFRTQHQLMTWLGSRQRAAALGSLRSSLAQDFSLSVSTTTFGTTVRTEDGRIAITPKWKTAMLILLVLYPTVMLLSRFLGPVLNEFGVQPWLAMWLSQAASVALLQWLLMPWAGRTFRRWLDPIDGAGLRRSAVGAAWLIAGYLVTLAVFESVQWLQYWGYARP